MFIPLHIVLYCEAKDTAYAVADIIPSRPEKKKNFESLKPGLHLSVVTAAILHR